MSVLGICPPRVQPERSDLVANPSLLEEGSRDFGLKLREGGGLSMTRSLSLWSVSIYQECTSGSCRFITQLQGSVFIQTYMGVCS